MPAAFSIESTRYHLTFDGGGIIVSEGEKLEITLV
jgi:hypothetical protein